MGAQAGRSERALDIITETIEIAHELVSELLRDDQETSGVHARTAGRARSVAPVVPLVQVVRGGSVDAVMGGAAARANRVKPLQLVERPLPQPGPGQVRVRVACCGVCRTDLHSRKETSRPVDPRSRPGTRSWER